MPAVARFGPWQPMQYALNIAAGFDAAGETFGAAC
jgi:hypothetical protein